VSEAERALHSHTLLDRIMHRITWTLAAVISKLYFRMSIIGREKLPDGPFILAPIHRSNLDSPFAATVTSRRMRFMGKDSLWVPKHTRRFLYAIGGFPVDRGSADREAMRTTMAMLERGEPVVMFPEGTRCFGPEVSPLFDGPAYVAVRTGVPIVPMGIGGSERAMRKGSKMVWPVKVAMIVGDPIPAPVVEAGKRAPRRAVKETTERLAAELQVVFDRAQAYVGRPNPPHPVDPLESAIASGE
jgi:1-acyl-sn-glycerol-3-phosphate acyltransferase